MFSFADQKRLARRALHTLMQRPAIYIPIADRRGGVVSGVPISVRVHTKWGMADIQTSRGLGHAPSRDVVFPKILFMIDDLALAGIKLRSKDVISLQPGLAFELDNGEVPDDITVSWYVTEMREADTVGFGVP